MGQGLKGITRSAVAFAFVFISFDAAAVVAPAPPTRSVAESTTTPPQPAIFRPGQSVHLKSPLTGLRAISADDSTENPKGSCLPAGTDVRIISDTPAGNVNAVQFSVDEGKVTDTNKYCESLKLPLATATVVYETVEGAFQAANYTTQELVSGVLVVPFKFHLADHSVTAGSTIGGYLGYRFGGLGASWTPMISGGLAIVDSRPAQISSSGSGTATVSPSDSQTLTGFTVAGGLIGTIASSKAQVGVLLGVDWAGKSAQYKYEGKPWLAFEIGYNFLGSAQ
jgi:hypothetical protein